MIGKKYPYPNRKYTLYKDRLEISPIKNIIEDYEEFKQKILNITTLPLMDFT